MADEKCAGCFLDGKKCLPTCPLCGYFPKSQLDAYTQVKNLFTRNGVEKMLKKLHNDEDKQAYALAITAEAKYRTECPIGGSYSQIRELRSKVDQKKEEINQLRQQVAYLQAALATQPVLEAPVAPGPVPASANDGIELELRVGEEVVLRGQFKNL